MARQTRSKVPSSAARPASSAMPPALSTVNPAGLSACLTADELAALLDAPVRTLMGTLDRLAEQDEGEALSTLSRWLGIDHAGGDEGVDDELIEAKRAIEGPFAPLECLAAREGLRKADHHPRQGSSQRPPSNRPSSCRFRRSRPHPLTSWRRSSRPTSRDSFSLSPSSSQRSDPQMSTAHSADSTSIYFGRSGKAPGARLLVLSARKQSLSMRFQARTRSVSAGLLRVAGKRKSSARPS